MTASSTPASRWTRASAPWLRRPAPFGRTSLRIVLPAGYAILFALFAWWLDRQTIGVAGDAYRSAFTVAANALPGLVVAGVLTTLTRRPGCSFLMVAALQALVYRASAIKLSVLGDPVGLQDLYFVTRFDPASFALLGKYVEHPVRLAAIALAAIGVVALAWRIEPPAFRMLRRAQLMLSLVSVGMIATLVTARDPWTRVYRADTVRPSRFSSMGGILHAGLMSNLVYSHNRTVHASRALDVAAVRRLLAATDVRVPAIAAGAPRPDIVVVLSESFFDARLMKGMAELPDPIPNVRAAIASGHGGAMHVPTFGGGTIRTEFEVLTGMPMSAFPEAKFPYVSLVREHIPSLVSHLERHGYRTVAIHGNAGSFWNRQNAYRALGFDRFITETGFPPDAPRSGRWIDDRTMTDLVLRELAADGPPKLVVALSIEAHGPYDDAKSHDQAGRDAIRIPSTLDADPALELRNYLFHIHHADAEFGRLVQAIEARRRPTVLLFFGDHLPGLRGVYNSLGFVNGDAATRQQVPWVLLRNSAGATPPASGGPTESWMLPGRLLQVAGLGDDPYFALTTSVAKRLAREAPGQEVGTRHAMDAAATVRLAGHFADYWPNPDTRAVRR